MSLVRMPERDNGQELALRSAINQAQRDLHAEPDTPSHILKTVQQQEEKFEKLTRELDKERQSVLNQFERSRQESETGTFASISETEDSFSFRRSAVNESVLESESSVDSKAYNNSHLIDSALDALREHKVMDTGDSMHYPGYGNGPDRSYNDYGSPAVNGHAESPGPKQQVKKTTQVTITKHTVQTRIVQSPDGRDSPAYDGRNYDRPADYPAHPDDYRGSNESPYPGDQYDGNRQYNKTPSIDGSDRPGYRGDPGQERYDRSYNDTPSDMYAPSVEGSDRYGTAPRSQNAYDSPRPQYGDRYDERPVEPRADTYNNYADPYDDRYPLPAHEDWDSRLPPEEGHYNGSYPYDNHHPDDITADTAHEQMAPLGAMDRTGSQDTVEYDKYDKDDPQWRTPDLQEIIDYLSDTNPAIVANAAGYLQHLTYGDDPIKNKTRSLGGIPILVELLGNPTPEIHKCACGALRNISYGKANEENKGAIKNAGGVPALVRLLRTTRDPDTKELVTGTLWNLSSSEPLKKAIIDDGLSVFVNDIIVPDSGWNQEDPENYPNDNAWSGVYRNTTGCLRNVSSSGLEARRKMRDCIGLVDSLVHVIKSAIDTNNVDNKVVENTMCIIRNLSFKICNEANHPDAIPAPPPRATPSRNGVASPPKKKPDDSGCFGGNKKKKTDSSTPAGKQATSTLPRTMTWDPNTPIPERRQPPRGGELLFAHEMVGTYLKLLSECSNHVTLEATTGTIQNISSGEWRWALYVRAQVRKEKGLAVLVELLRLENDKIVSAVARALRNLALDTRNKELIGKYAMRDLVFRLPSSDVSASSATDSSRQQLSTDTLVAILNALQEMINRNPENSKSLRDASGIEKLVSITKSRNKYPPTVIKCAFQVLSTMWNFKDLRPLYKQDGWEEQHFSPGVWTTSRSPNKSQTLQTPSSERMGGPTPQRSSSTPGATPAGRLDYEASPLPVKTAPPRDEAPPPFSYDSYDRRQEQQQQRSAPYDTIRSQGSEPVVARDERDMEDPYINVRQPSYARDSMSAYSDEAPKAAAEEEPLPPATDQPGARDSMSQFSDEASSYVPERQEPLPASFAVPQTRDSMSAYSEEAPSERSRDDIPMRELNYASIDHGQVNETSGGRRGPPVGGVAVFGGRDPPPQRDNVVYAQVNKNRQPSSAVYLDSGGGPAGDSWV
ncbi:catenin delta-2-like isoform X3 [Patiria miniata]|uniref:Armadillo repeat protein deleted in velo-cardio-facial syndrome n=1 Tax=Patiria miniata TaxID=46514 RepID=A0A913ZNH2_PATMI|nr:catenin delta-2-like isoform X3 [Patiria miniata]